MGSPISPIVTNLYMGDLETKAIQSAQNPPSFWRRFVDDTLTIMKSSQIDNFLQHLNSLDHHIQFTKEDSIPDGSMPFLDVLITPREDGSLDTTVYRKPTHTDLYLQWDSNHTLTSKYGVVGTLHHRAQLICSSPELLQQEEKHLHQALTRCKYPEWALNRAKLRSKAKKTRTQNKNTNVINSNQSQKPYMVVPYHKVWVRASKRPVTNIVYRYILKEEKPSKASWWPPRIKIQSLERVVSSIDLSVAGLTAMRNT